MQTKWRQQLKTWKPTHISPSRITEVRVCLTRAQQMETISSAPLERHAEQCPPLGARTAAAFRLPCAQVSLYALTADSSIGNSSLVCLDCVPGEVKYENR